MTFGLRQYLCIKAFETSHCGRMNAIKRWISILTSSFENSVKYGCGVLSNSRVLKKYQFSSARLEGKRLSLDMCEALVIPCNSLNRASHWLIQRESLPVEIIQLKVNQATPKIWMYLSLYGYFFTICIHCVLCLKDA